MAQRRVIAGHAESRDRALVPDPYSQHPQLPRVAGGGEPAYGALPLPERGGQTRTAPHTGAAGIAAAEHTQPRDGPGRLCVTGPVDDRAERTVDLTEHRRPRRIPCHRTDTLGQRPCREGRHSPSMPDRVVPALAGVTVPLSPAATGKHRRDGRATPTAQCAPDYPLCAATTADSSHLRPAQFDDMHRLIGQAERRTGLASAPARDGTGAGYQGVRRRPLRDRHLLPGRRPTWPAVLVDRPARVAVDGHGPGDVKPHGPRDRHRSRRAGRQAFPPGRPGDPRRAPGHPHRGQRPPVFRARRWRRPGSGGGETEPQPEAAQPREEPQCRSAGSGGDEPDGYDG
jgi:hypothetical protein